MYALFTTCASAVDKYVSGMMSGHVLAIGIYSIILIKQHTRTMDVQRPVYISCELAEDADTASAKSNGFAWNSTLWVVDKNPQSRHSMPKVRAPTTDEYKNTTRFASTMFGKVEESKKKGMFVSVQIKGLVDVGVDGYPTAQYRPCSVYKTNKIVTIHL